MLVHHVRGVHATLGIDGVMVVRGEIAETQETDLDAEGDGTWSSALEGNEAGPSKAETGTGKSSDPELQEARDEAEECGLPLLRIGHGKRNCNGLLAPRPIAVPAIGMSLKEDWDAQSRLGSFGGSTIVFDGDGGICLYSGIRQAILARFG